MEKAISGFRTAGIYPLNPDRFTEDDFAAANQMRPLIIEAVPDKVAPGLASQSAPSTPDLDRPSTPDILPTTSRESPAELLSVTLYSNNWNLYPAYYKDMMLFLGKSRLEVVYSAGGLLKINHQTGMSIYG
nr:unnamed protein product [Callosobruchus chinensis]